ncbi:MAG: hypothetical protein WC208_15595 [Gallionella sp.]|jgi:hypothetical protein
MSNSTIRYGIDTIVIDEKILQGFYSEYDNIRTNLIRSVFDTGEQQVRDALISLGWTPPKKEEQQ